MRNISFDNPYLLLLAIPLLAAVIIPYAISIRKDNRSKSTVASFVLHIVMVLCVTLAAAGLTTTTVMTETNVYVVADVSYSSQKNLETINGYIEDIEKNLPRNSKLGVVCFGRDQTVLTDMGKDIVGVENAKVDVSGTDIAGALEYTSKLFDSDVIKRIVLITDGMETDSESTKGLIAAIENLYLKDIYLDSVYLDNNLADNVNEVQISDVEFTESTYVGHEATADVLVQSNLDTKAILSVSVDGNPKEKKSVSLTKGYNVVNVELSTAEAGEFFYELEIVSERDETQENNVYSIRQQVTDKLKVLFLYEAQEDLEKTQELYGESAEVEAFEVTDPDVPFSIEQICEYDEIVLSNCDVRKLVNYMAVIDSIDKAVSLYGKSLVSIGNTYIQNKTEEDEVLVQLEDMLPVKFGNEARDAKLVAIILDISRSMSHTNTAMIRNAKKAAAQILNLLADTDYVMVVPFAGDSTILQSPTPAINREEIIEKINALEVWQGTMLGAAMEAVYNQFETLDGISFSSKEVYIISDGVTSDTDKVKHVEAATTAYQKGVVTTSLYIYRGEIDGNTIIQDARKRLEDIATAGGGKYYTITSDNIDDIILNEIADELREDIVLQTSALTFKRQSDDVLRGLTSLPQISGYVFSKAKASATTVLTADYAKAGGGVSEAPIYAYWSYGNGKVSSLTTSIAGDWVSNWSTDERAAIFYDNLLSTNIPQEKIDRPYTLNVEKGSAETQIEVVPAVLNPYAEVEVEITAPNGEVTAQTLVFDSQKYYYAFETPLLGEYKIQIKYSAGGENVSYFSIPYFEEYDRFATSDISNLRDVVRNRGTVNENADFEMTNDESKVSTYEVNYTVALLIVSVVLYVADIVVRKMKLNDFKTLFRRKSKGGTK